MYINCYSTAILSTLVYLWLKELVISENTAGGGENFMSSTTGIFYQTCYLFPNPFLNEDFFNYSDVLCSYYYQGKYHWEPTQRM